MQKSTSVLLYILSGAIIVSAVGLSSCSKDDDEPAAKPVLTFTETAITANEDDASIEIKVKLDKAASEDIKIEYEFSGTAQDDETATDETDNGDYEVDSDQDHGEIEIQAGETTATIILHPYTDGQVEDDETIILTLTDVDDIIQLGTDLETTVTLKQQDGMFILLSWPAAGTDGLADMDFFVLFGETADSPEWDDIATGSVYHGYQINYEAVFIPKVLSGEFFGYDYTDTSFGMIYNYYDGSLDPLEFEVDFVEFIDGDFEDDEDADVFEATYTANNKNKWTGQNYPTTVVQTLRLNNGEFEVLDDIAVPDEGSRQDVAVKPLTRTVTTRTVPPHLRKGAIERLLHK